MSEDPEDGGTEDPDAGEGDDPEGGGAKDAGEDEPLSGLADRVRRSRERRSGDEDAASRDPFADLERDAGGGAVDDAGDVTIGSASDGDDEDPFEAMDVEDIEEEEVWESLEEEEEGTETTDQPGVGSGSEAERVERDDPHAERPDHVVEKTSYCQRCRFLSDPPDLQCTHEGTDIVEVVDSERFRVRGCPMVDRDGPVEGRGDDRNG